MQPGQIAAFPILGVGDYCGSQPIVDLLGDQVGAAFAADPEQGGDQAEIMIANQTVFNLKTAAKGGEISTIIPLSDRQSASLKQGVGLTQQPIDIDAGHCPIGHAEIGLAVDVGLHGCKGRPRGVETVIDISLAAKPLLFSGEISQQGPDLDSA